MLKLFITLILLAFALIASFLMNLTKIHAASWYSADWGYRKRLIIPSTSIEADLTDFPVYIDLNDMGSTFFENVKSDGSDLVVTASDGTTSLERELVDINTGTETGEIWFKAPSLSSSTNTEFYIYYGNQTASETNSEEVWSNGFIAVHHMSNDPTDISPALKDSTSNAYHGTMNGSMTTDDLIQAQVGSGIEFDSDDYFNTAYQPSGLTSVTFSSWIYLGNDNINFPYGFNSGSDGFYSYIRASDDLIGWGVEGNNLQIFTEPITSGTWFYFTTTYESGVTGGKEIFIDGNSIHSGTQSGAITASNSYRIGERTSSNSFTGVLDETRISSVVRSDEWISAEYDNQVSPGSFYSISNQERPHYIDYKAKLTNLSDYTNARGETTSCINDGGSDTCDFRINLYDEASGGNLLFQEVHEDVEISNYNGVFQFYINSVCLDWTAQASPPANCTGSPTVSGVDWGSDPTIYIELEFDDDGNGDFASPETFERKLIASNPYAYFAQTAGSLAGFSIENFIILQPGTAQAINATTNDSIIFINETGSSTPNFIDFKQGGTSQFIIDNEGNVSIGGGSDAFLDIKASTTSSAQINFTSSSGIDPSAPVSGDIWFNGTNFYGYNGTSNIDFLAAGAIFLDSGTLSYLFDTTEDFAVGGQTIDNSSFGIDVSLGDFYFGSNALSDPSLIFENTNGNISQLNFNDSNTISLAQKIDLSNYYSEDWEYRQKLTINSSEVNSDLSNFTVYVNLSDLGADFFRRVKSDGTDIVVTSSDGMTKLERELVDIDTASQSGELWFKAPTLSSSVDTEFYIYYGNPSASEVNSTSTWDSSYQAVYHLEEDPSGSAPQIQDSTINNKDGTSGGAMTSGDLVAGKIGKASQLDGDNDRILLPGYTLTNFTFSSWVRYDSLTISEASATFFSLEGSRNGYIRMEYSTAQNGIFLYIYTGSTTLIVGPTAITAGEWYHTTSVKSGNNYSFYVNGVQVGSTSTASLGSSTGVDALGARRITGGAGDYNAPITSDESRVNNTALSADFIAAEYSNQSSTQTFYSIDDQQYIYSDNTKLGINTDNPEEALDVVGDIQVSGDIITSTGTSNIGSALEPFSNLYATNLYITGTTAIGSDVTLAGNLLASTTTESIGEVTSITSADNIGLWTDIVINNSGFPVIAFRDETNQQVGVLVCRTIKCNINNTLTFYSSSGNDGDEGLSVEIVDLNLPIISYYETTGNDHQLIRCSNDWCASATLTAVDNGGGGQYSDIVTRADGTPILFSQHGPDTQLESRDCTTSACSGFGSVIINDNSSASTGKYPSAVILRNGFPFVAYHDETNGDLKVLACSNVDCTGDTGRVLIDENSINGSADSGEWPAVVLSKDGYPMIAYQDKTNTDIYLLICKDQYCSTFESMPVAVNGNDNGNFQIGLTTKIDGSPIISYFNDTTDTLNIYECVNPGCESGNNTVVSSGDSEGKYSSIAKVNSKKDLFAISYYDETNGDLEIYYYEKKYVPTSSLGTADNYFQSLYTASIYTKNASISNFDVAEEYFVEDLSIEPGDVVRFRKNSINNLIVEKTDVAYDAEVIGVVSTEPGLYLKSWEESNPKSRPVALVGRVPVKVTDENGPIERGDYLTPSSTPGYAMKANGEGFIIGRAVDSFGTDSEGDSKFVKEYMKKEREEAEQLIKEYSSIKENTELTEQEVIEIDIKIAEYKQKLEKLTVEIDDLEYQGKRLGRIMMFVDLSYVDQSAYKDPINAFENASDESALNLLSFFNLKENSLEISAELLELKGNVALEGNLTVLGQIKGVSSSFGKVKVDQRIKIPDESTGTFTISPQTTDIFIESSLVQSDSTIFLTSSTPGHTLSITEQREGEGFTAKLSSTSEEELVFRYVIIN